MKYNLNINQAQALNLGIKNINQAHIFDLLTSASTWATTEIVNNNVYYFVARQMIVEELKLLNLKPDTVYRHLKSLNKINLIDYIKVGKKDCIRITEKGKKYLSKSKKNNSTMSEINSNRYVGNKSELEQNSEINLRKSENNSENNSELNPTYHYTKIDHYTNNTLSKEQKRKRELNFKEFKEILERTNIEFKTQGLGYLKEHKGFKIKNGYIYNLHSEKYLDKEEAYKIWEFLYQHKDEVLKNAS